ncbi:hypothetical protein ACH5RR_037032 [Cinchona calisaya]|uniref:Uncharacterized protein n=1 Tax=Cinchona calisaya TaxID=153742 RepID=A0ABD2Y679_9GENT
MLHKIFGARKLAPAPTPVGEGRSAAALKIIHAGGLVEQYYMAVPAAWIIDKYPSFILARPDVFRRPWGAIVRPQEILIPGQKYFVVPRKTVKKLKRRINRTSGLNSSLHYNSQSSVDASSAEISSQKKKKFSCSSSFVQNRFGIVIKSKNKTKSRYRRVRFFGIDAKKDCGSISSEHSKSAADTHSKKSVNLQLDRKKRRLRNIVQWHPSLTSISEDHCK